MKDRFFNTDKKRQAAIASFRGLLSDPGWKLLEELVKENIKVITKQILDGGTETTKEQMDRLRDKLTAHGDIINTPRSTIKRLTTSPAGEEPQLDPYPTVEEAKAERKKASG